MSNKIIIVSNRLPVSISANEGKINIKKSSGGLATGLSTAFDQYQCAWIGWPGGVYKDENVRDKVNLKLISDQMYPVFLNEWEIENYYEGYSNSVLWPNFHYFPQYVQYQDSYWESYKQVNKKFLDMVLDVYEEGDTIWVHDYHLMLLSGMLREHFPDVNIGYFLHIPFPSYEIFRMLFQRTEILDGLLGADLLGFQTYDDVRHFQSCITRLKGYDNTMGEIKINYRTINVDAFPIGIDYQKFHKTAQSKAVQDSVESFREHYKNNKLILSVDRLDFTKGIPDRIKGFEQFLEEYPDHRGKVSMTMIVVPSRDKVFNYARLKKEIDELVGRVNGKFSTINWTPIEYFYKGFPFEDLVALYSLADIMLVTPLRDGMNLVCKEYVACCTDGKGVLILSERAGSAKSLADAIRVNPNDTKEIAWAINQAMEMPEDEQQFSIERMQRNVEKYNNIQWFKLFLDRLEVVKGRQTEMFKKVLDKGSFNKIKKEIPKKGKTLLLLDYDGSMVPFVNNPQDAKPDKDLKDILQTLIEDERYEVVVITGRDKDTINKWLGDLQLHFLTEHGVWKKEIEGEWTKMENLEDDWKDHIRPILELYVDRTPGSTIEEKNYSLVWHYRVCETDFGALRARELISTLNYYTRNMDLQVLMGDKVIEVKSSLINKGTAASHWINKQDWDNIIAIGDDRTDEDTFEAVGNKGVSIKVGKPSPYAEYVIPGPKEVRDLLKELAK